MKKLKLLYLLILCIGISIQGFSQQTVTGKVTDADDGFSLIGVNVVIQGTTTGAVTDINGDYSITVPSNNATLVYSYIGYKSKTEQVNGRSNINIQMDVDQTTLGEVVVTGLASSVKRSNAANAVASIDAKDLTEITSQSTMDGALYGKFKGANISSNSGAPGGGINIRLRGISSLTANSQPLYIVDGVYIDNSSIQSGAELVSNAQNGGSGRPQDNPSNRIADIDPEDIAKIEILKGASAAAIYGSRAGGGVVIITTKRGKSSSQGVGVSLSQTTGMTQMLNPLGQRSWDAAKVEAAFGIDEVAIFNANPLVDYEEELFGNTGLSSTTRLSVAGGDDRSAIFGGVTIKDEEGIVEGSGYEKASVRLNLDQKVGSNVDVALSTNYIWSSADRGYFGNDNSGTTMGVSFVATPAWAQLLPDANGLYPDNPYASSNFLQTAALMTNNEEVNRILAGGSINTRLLTTDNQSLKLVLRGGIDAYTLVTNVIFPRALQFESNNNGTDGASIRGVTTSNNTNVAAILVHSYNTSNDLGFRTQIGFTEESFESDNVISSATFLVEGQQNLDQAGSVQTVQNRIIQKDRGFFAQEEVNYRDQFIATVGVRGDKSTNNGDANELFYYPKASLAINVHELPFWDSGIISQLKPRVAYGESGSFANFGSKFTPLLPVVINGTTGSLIGTQLGEKDLTPENQKELELGLDIGLLDNKYQVDVTYYKKEVENLLLNINLPTSSGFTTQVFNAGDLENKGWEIGLTTTPIKTNDFEWGSRVGFWTNESMITKLNVPAFNLGAFGATLGTYRIEEGFSPTQIVGIGDAADDPDGDGLVVFGDSEADFNLSWSNSISYKKFDLNLLWHWKEGGDNVNLSSLLSDLSGTSYDFDDNNLDPSGVLSNGNYRLANLGVSAGPFVEDGSYIRMREIGLYYNVSRNNINGLADVRIGVSGRNLLNFFDYQSYDPEVSNFGAGAISSSVEVTPFPSSKSVFFHVNANF